VVDITYIPTRGASYNWPSSSTCINVSVLAGNSIDRQMKRAVGVVRRAAWYHKRDPPSQTHWRWGAKSCGHMRLLAGRLWRATRYTARGPSWKA
jgi:hypothetical protein